jgi:hypothetical protein
MGCGLGLIDFSFFAAQIGKFYFTMMQQTSNFGFIR